MRKTRTLRLLIVLGMFVGMTLFVVIDVKAEDVNLTLNNPHDECIYDVDLLLEGEFTVTEAIVGIEGQAYFDDFRWEYIPEYDRTGLEWWDPRNGDCSEAGQEGWIAPDEEFHIGWTTSPHSSETDMTILVYTVPDEGGEHVKLGDVDMVNARGWFVGSIYLLTVKNDILPQRTMVVSNFRYEFVYSPYALADLNGPVLNGSLTSISGGGTLAFNAELAVEIPLGVQRAQSVQDLPHVVIAFDVKQQGASGNPNTLYVQFHLPTPPTPAVGGIWVSADKFGLLAPYIGVASTILVATVATAIYVNRVKRRKEKQ